MVTAPIPENLGGECKKAAKILKAFRIGTDGVDKYIPPSIIERAKGLVILTVVKAGFLFSGRMGFGLVVAKLPSGQWSAPSAIGTASFGAGLQIGAEITEFVIILNNQRAVDSFTYGGNVALGGNISVAAGPYGRNGEADVMVTAAAVYSYSRTMGAFAGISLEGTVFVERRDANEKFYGREITAKQILGGEVAPPDATKVLYDAINMKTADNVQYPHPPGYNPAAAASSSASAAPTSTTSAATTTSTIGSPNSVRRAPMPIPSSGGGGAAPPPLPQRGPRAQALYKFVGQQPGDLSFNEGDIINIIEKGTPESWWRGSLNGREGTFPGNYVKLL